MEDALNSGDYHNHLAIAYRLIMDNKRIEDETTIEEFKYAVIYFKQPFLH